MDPTIFYERGRKLYPLDSDDQNSVHLYLRKKDKRLFVCKKTPSGDEEIADKRIHAEICLLQAINSDYIINAHDIHKYDGSLYIFLEYMDGGDMTKIIQEY